MSIHDTVRRDLVRLGIIAPPCLDSDMVSNAERLEYRLRSARICVRTRDYRAAAVCYDAAADLADALGRHDEATEYRESADAWRVRHLRREV